MSRSTWLLLLLCGCGPSVMDREPDHLPPVKVEDPSLARRRVFQNPGGMWTPRQVAAQGALLRELGLAIDPTAFADPMAHPLGAVVSLGGCSASFVSPKGLLVTNHHCATGALQFNSTPEHNLLHDGFLAKAKSDEKSNGPTARVYVTQAFRDVTGPIRTGLAEIDDPKQRYDVVEQRVKDRVAACEKDRDDLRCSVVAYYGGEQYVEIEQLEIRDVRLVYAPAEGVGNFGGEVDNWRWPRHGGDYAFFRAYVGPDGKPADFDEKNVPYQPRHHLEVSTAGLKPHDLVFVAGYPGRTTRLRTAQEVAEAVDWQYPHNITLCNEYIALLQKLGKGNEDLAIKGRRLERGLSNWRTNMKGMLDGLVKGGLKDKKVALEAELKAWVAAHPDHAATNDAIDGLKAVYDKSRITRDRVSATDEVLWMSSMLGAADTIVHMAEERPKADAARHPNFQKRNWKRIEQGQKRAQKTYDRTLELAKLKLALVRAARLPKEQRPAVLGMIVGDAEPSEDVIAAAIAPLYEATELENLERRTELLQNATSEELAKSADPLIQLALKLRPILQANEDRGHADNGETMMYRPVYVAALRESRGGVLAPDANRTLRITYGTVRGYKPTPDAPEYFPFTKLSEMVAKNTGKEPFDAPQNLVDSAKTGPFEPYVAAEVGEVPVDFLSDLDITGGNSGSPTLNAKGQLVGLAFDGNYEAMASDWLFMPEITRSIHVDIRYALWIMDRVDGADHLLTEMGITPSIP